MECQAIVKCVCPMKHKTKRFCFKSQAACTVCAEEDRQRERIRRRNEYLDAERDAKRSAYAQQLADAQAEIDHHKRRLKDSREVEDLAKTLEQRKAQLANLKETTKNLDNKKQSSSSPKSAAVSKPSRKAVAAEDGNEDDWSSAKKQWEHFKRLDGADNETLDTLMNMIGLEDVKDKFLSIKLEVDTAVRQELDMSNKRFGCSMLGNPGTGEAFPFFTRTSTSINIFQVKPLSLGCMPSFSHPLVLSQAISLSKQQAQLLQMTEFPVAKRSLKRSRKMVAVPCSLMKPISWHQVPILEEPLFWTSSLQK